MNQHSSKNIWIFVMALMGLFLVLFFLSPKKEYSVQENRFLENIPKLSADSFWSGEYMKNLETYSADHFPFRDAFMTLHTWKERLMGKCLINGVYICKDDYYIEQYPQPQNTQRIIAAFQRLEQKVVNADITVMLVPTAVTIYADKLPATAKNFSQTEEITAILSQLQTDTIDVTNALLEAKNQTALFYRLDHHWTTYGAYIAYREYCEKTGLAPTAEDSFTKTIVTEEFQGTIYSKLNDYFAGSDEITIYEKPMDVDVFYLDTGEHADTFYAESYLSEKDKYSYFLNNIHPMVEITNNKAVTNDELVLIKDSYANSIIPFLASHYAKIYVVDTRYYKSSVTEFINEHTNVKKVLVLYNMNTIDADLGIGGIY